jgi:serine protease Do
LHRRVIRYHNLTVDSAILVVSVEPKSPASRALLREGDLIVEIDDHPTSGIDVLHRCLAEKEIGTSAVLTILRGADKKVIEIRPEFR